MLSNLSLARRALCCLTSVVSFTAPATRVRHEASTTLSFHRRRNSVSPPTRPFHLNFLSHQQTNCSYKKLRFHSMSRIMNHPISEDSSSSQESTIFRKLGYKLGATTSTVVSLAFFSVLAYKRDAFMLTFFIGSIINGITSKILKRIINQERPTSMIVNDKEYAQESIQPSDKGMPSSHAMSLGFIGTFSILAILLDHTFLGQHTNNIRTMLYVIRKVTAVLLLVSYCVISLWYRVDTQLHTTEQVVVGLSLGIINAFLWRIIGFTHGITFNNNRIMTVKDWVSQHIVPSHGSLPIQFMIIPALVGLIVVGSFERRLSSWLDKSKSKGLKLKL